MSTTTPKIDLTDRASILTHPFAWIKRTTNIEWTHHTINFWWGCTKVSPACAHCYAESWSAFTSTKLFGRRIRWGDNQERGQRLEKARKEALRLNKRAERAGVRMRVFVNSMSDWLDDRVPIEWLAFLLETIFMCPWLDFQLLTKRPQNFTVRSLMAGMHMMGYRDGQTENAPKAPPSAPEHIIEAVLSWSHGDALPNNVWIGATLEEPNVKRLEDLLAIPARIRFLSCEPLLQELDFVRMSAEMNPKNHPWRNAPILWGIHWVIAGGESGDYARPSHPEWFRKLRDQCKSVGVPFFFKQHGEWMPAGSDAAHLPADKTFKSQWMPGPSIPHHETGEPLGTQTLMIRPGKDLTGRLLDGVEHSEFPA